MSRHRLVLVAFVAVLVATPGSVSPGVLSHASLESVGKLFRNFHSRVVRFSGSTAVVTPTTSGKGSTGAFPMHADTSGTAVSSSHLGDVNVAAFASSSGSIGLPFNGGVTATAGSGLSEVFNPQSMQFSAAPSIPALVSGLQLSAAGSTIPNGGHDSANGFEARAVGGLNFTPAGGGGISLAHGTANRVTTIPPSVAGGSTERVDARVSLGIAASAAAGGPAHGARLESFTMGLDQPNVSTVPEPASLTLLGAGLIGLAVLARRAVPRQPASRGRALRHRRARPSRRLSRA
jgi:hypothetical protein